MSADNKLLCSIIINAIEVMGEKPKDFARMVTLLAEADEISFIDPIGWLQENVLSGDANENALHALGISIRRWDSISHATWLCEEPKHSLPRRESIYKLLKLPPAVCEVLTTRIPIFTLSQQPIVIAEEHNEWYSTRELSSNFYWRDYVKYLRSKKWDDDAIAKLDESTNEVVSRLSDPTQAAVYQTKGLVVGYVQSGKTANFSGVLTKAADSGYRFIIVLAGTLDILRSQTQRRIDKEIIGKELLYEEYASDPDWHEFMSHGARPSEIGSFDWERLTSSTDDYAELDVAISALEFKAMDPSSRYNTPDNLAKSPLRIIVIKKIPAVMVRLAKDLHKIRSKLAHVPTLIIDDESDQASINTIDPSKVTEEAKRRTATNREIVKLLKTLPRAQYLGYTATPFANVFTDPTEAEDLFPKDFIIALPRPKGYMGVSDFYDFDSGATGWDSNEKSFVRDIVGSDEGDGKNSANRLRDAIDCFVLAGAIKLYRASANKEKYSFKHHTMLVHHSVSKADHDQIAEAVRRTFDKGGYASGGANTRLSDLFDNDFRHVSGAKGKDLPLPLGFSDLGVFVGECVAKLLASKTVRIVNGDNKDDTPDFDKNPVWAILVGGTKLSRGYTVEGLTTTYFRRVSTTTDTLMQMGRWFGYRPGYNDLVRLFIGRNERFGAGGKTTIDLYKAFEGMCKDEEKFRREIRKYKGSVTPRSIPPLVPSHLKYMRPVARNKMYNTYITFRNFGGTWVETTMAPVLKAHVASNQQVASALLATCTNRRVCSFNGTKQTKTSKAEKVNMSAFCGITKTDAMRTFLKNYQWLKGGNLLVDELAFLSGDEGDPGVDDWIVMAPLIKDIKHGVWKTKLSDFTEIPVQYRARVGVRYGAYSTSDHRAVAEHLALVTTAFTPSEVVDTGLLSPRRGVLLLYPVQGQDETLINIGFSLLFPKNKLATVLSYSVRNAKRQDAVVVDVA